MKMANCKESFVDKSFLWLRMFADCVNFEQVKNDEDIKRIDALFNIDMILPKHIDIIKQTVYCEIKCIMFYL